MTLAILKGFQNESIVIPSVPFAIGRCRSANFIIPHVNVSRNHCKIVKENESWKIYDFSSSGTFVNDNLVGREGSVTLNNGDIVRFGPFESNLGYTFYSCEVSSESSTDLGVTASTAADNEKCINGKERLCKKSNLRVTFKEDEGIKESLENCDLNCEMENEKSLEVKQETKTSIAQCTEEHQLENGSKKGESEKIEELAKELQSIKNTLNNLEGRNCSLQKESPTESNTKAPASDVNLLENLADVMETELQCTICSELFVTAITLSCTHTFCKHCINQWKKKQKTCPICRKKITNETQSLVLDNYIDKMVGNLSVELKERRESIIKERKEGGPCRKRARLKK